MGFHYPQLVGKTKIMIILNLVVVSDGISNWLSDSKIAEIINGEHENYSEKLCLEAIISGSSDDVSAIVIKCENR